MYICNLHSLSDFVIPWKPRKGLFSLIVPTISVNFICKVQILLYICDMENTKQFDKLKEIASRAIRDKFDTRDTVTALEAIDDAIECGLNELANDMAKDFLSENDASEIALFRAHFKNPTREVVMFMVFDVDVRSVIYDSINHGHALATTPLG